MLDLIGQLTLAVLCAPQFGVYFGVGLDFALELTALLAIGISIGISIPDLIACIAFAVEITAGINVAIAISLPSVSVKLALAISAQLILVLGLIAALNAVIAVGGAELEAFTYSGPGGSLGGAMAGQLDAFPSVEAIVLAATSSGAVAASSIAGTNLLGGGSSWERGLCSVSFAPPPHGGITATGTPTTAIGSLNGNATRVVTGITITNPGAGYDPKAPPAVTFSDATPILGATFATPIVLHIANTQDVTSLLVAGVTGPAAAGLMPGGKPTRWSAKVLTGTTVELYKPVTDPSAPPFTIPSVGTGTWVSGNGGTATGAGAGAAASVVMGGGAMAQVQGFFDGLVFADGLVVAGALKLSDILSASFALFTGLLGELQAEAKALASASASIGVVPPSISGNLSIVASIDATLTAALQFFPPLPSIQASLSAAVSGRAAIILNLLAELGLQLGFGTEKLNVFAYNGAGSGLAPALTSRLAAGWPDLTPASAPSNVVILSASDPVAKAALGVFFPAAA